MQAKIVKVSDKGQISIPKQIRDSTGIKKGDNLVLVEEGGRIMLERVTKKEFKDLLKHSERVAEKLWDNEADEVWNEV